MTDKALRPFRPILTAMMAVTLSMAMPNVTHASSGSGAFGGLSSIFGAKTQEILPVHEAFGVSATQDGERLTVQFRVTDGYYIYRDKVALKLPDGMASGQWQFDQSPNWVDDPQFGRVAVFESDVVATTTLASTEPVTDTVIGLKWQGCAKAGLCYPPETTNVTVTLGANPDAVKAMQMATANANSQTDSKVDAANTAKLTTQATSQDSANLSANPSTDMSGADGVASSVGQYTLDHSYTPSESSSSNPVVMIGLLFLAGLLLAFTPCIYPMVPIVANIVAKQQSTSTKRGFVLSMAYGVGVASAYGILGALIAWFGQALGITAWFQKTWVLAIVAGLFVLYAMMMFGWVQIRLPSAIANVLQNNSQRADSKLGSVTGSYLAGMLSALVVSPCVSAPMAGALTAVAGSGSALFGFVAMFALGLGLSVPLILVGAAQGKWMPKAGAWMDKVRQFGGLMLIGVALLLIERILLNSLMLVLWAVWFVVLSLWFWRLSKVGFRVLSVLSAIWAGCLVAGAAMGATDAWRPLSIAQPTTGYTEKYPDIKITTLHELDQILATRQKVLVDLTADWCIECRIMERELFTHRPAALSDYQVVKLDITETTDESRAVLARYQLFGPPALLIYQEGKLEQVLLGQVERADFEMALAK